MTGDLDKLSTAFNGLLIAAATLACVQLKDWLFGRVRKKTHAPIAKLQKHNDAIKLELLRVFANMPTAIRAYVGQYQNGQYFDSGMPIFRISRTHEEAIDGVTYEQEDWYDLLASNMIEEVALVLEEGTSFTPLWKIRQSRFKALLEKGNVKATARVAIKLDGEVKGYLGVDFQSDQEPEGIDYMNVAARKIALQLIEVRNANK